MRYKAFLKPPLRLLLAVGLLFAGGYPLTANAGGTVTDCNTYGTTATQGVFLPGTLGAALVGGGDVTFKCDGTITIAPEIRINADTRIDATGQSVTLSGNNTNSVFWILNTRKLDLINLTITQGASGDNGGGIRNLGGTVTLTNCVVSGNTAVSVGGGIANEVGSTMTLTNTTVSGNSASNTVTNAAGGGIFNIAKMTLINSTVSKNSVTAAPNAPRANMT